MDLELEKRINETIEHIKRISPNDYPEVLADPVAKMMLVALLHESQKITDYIDGLGDKIVERFCDNFIPRDKVDALPAISVVEARFKPKKDTGTINIGGGVSFQYKYGDNRQYLNFLPIFSTVAIPYNDIYVLTKNRMSSKNSDMNIMMDRSNIIWLGINSQVEVESLRGFTVAIKGVGNVSPVRISTGNDERELEFADISRMDSMDMAEPFDSQQTSMKFLSMVENWKDSISNINDISILSITDKLVERDIFKPRAFPRQFQQWLESETLDCFKSDTIWLKLEYPADFIVPDDCQIIVNAVPVTNVDVNSLTLTQTSPIAKLQKQENSYFLQVVETSNSAYKQGFSMQSDEYIIRDFDASCYHNGNLYRDIRNIYNHFIDDYYAFLEYNGIKDGETIKQLRELLNRIGKSVGTQNSKYSFDSGTYVMKKMDKSQNSISTKVSYISTMGKLGNSILEGSNVENRKLPALEKDLPVILSGRGGVDKATADEKYELLRYYTLTDDRLFTKKDIEAFIRKEVIRLFGKDEFKRINIKMEIHGAAGEKRLLKGLYISLEYRDKKNYEKAIANSFKSKLYQQILNKSCISMPIVIDFINLES